MEDSKMKKIKNKDSRMRLYSIFAMIIIGLLISSGVSQIAYGQEETEFENNETDGIDNEEANPTPAPMQNSEDDADYEMITPKSYGPFSRFFDNINLFFTYNQEKKAVKALEIADKKLSHILYDLENKVSDKDYSEEYERAMKTVEKALEKIESNGEIKSSGDALSNLSKIEERIKNHYQKVITVKERILERQREEMPDDKIEHLESVFGNITQHFQDMESQFAYKKERALLKYKAMSGKNESEFDEELKEINEETGLSERQRSMAKWQLGLAQDSLRLSKQRFEDFLGTINETEYNESITEIRSQLEEAEELLMISLANLEENDYETISDLSQEIKELGDELNKMILSLKDSQDDINELLENTKDDIANKRTEHVQRILEKVPEEAKQGILNEIENANRFRERFAERDDYSEIDENTQRNRTQSENSNMNSINSYEDSDETDSPEDEEKEEDEGDEHIVLVGGERDEHGCLGPAGYTWSEEIGACARKWEINSDELILVARTAVAKATMTHRHDKESLTVLSIEPLNCEGCYLVRLDRNDYKNNEPPFTVEVIVDTKTVNSSKSSEFEVIYVDGKVRYAGIVEKPTPCDTLKIERVISDSDPKQVVIDITFEKSDVVCTQEISYENVLGEIELANSPASVTIRLQGEDVYTKTF